MLVNGSLNTKGFRTDLLDKYLELLGPLPELLELLEDETEFAEEITKIVVNENDLRDLAK